MSFNVGKLWRSAAWIGALALATQVAVTHAEEAPSSGDPTVPVEATFPPLDAAPLTTDSADVDFTPTGSTANSGQRRSPAFVGTPAGSEAPSSTGALESLLHAPLPPEAPPPAPSASIDLPEAVQTPEGASPQAEAPPPAAVATTESPAALSEAKSPAPEAVEAPASPASAEAPATAEAPQNIAGAIADALASLAARPEKLNSLGASDWKAAREAIRQFYAERANAPVWVGEQGLTAAGRSALAQLNRADEDGLDLGAFALPPASFAETQPERLADVEATLSAAAVAYALQASGGRIAPTTISPLVTARPEVADPKAALKQIASAADPAEELARFNPSQKGYWDLRAELSRLRGTAPVATIPLQAGPTLRIGMADSRVPLIRARFGLGSAADPAAARVYDVRLASTVAAFQKSRGLAADGAFTSATTEALFGDPNIRRKAAILANMEMWRWQPRDMGERRVEINVPDFTLRVLDGNDVVLRARVIVGKPDTPTPIFSNEIKYLLVNPVWRVPDSIIKKEMLPKLAGDPDYLTRRGFKVTQVGDRLVVEQPPGEANALGHILFMFPNEHAVYLHDTPSRDLFASARRAFSHGCIRVEQPMRLAELVMGGAARGWSAGRIESMIGSNERTVFPPQPLPIHIQYFTEFVDGSGALQDREDVYGLTARVAAMLSRMRQD
jgi:murein L,D-transpeptidase YcbB/YkuD